MGSFQIPPAILVGPENISPPLAAPDDVVRRAGKHDPGNSRHGCKVERRSGRVKAAGGSVPNGLPIARELK